MPNWYEVDYTVEHEGGAVEVVFNDGCAAELDADLGHVDVSGLQAPNRDAIAAERLANMMEALEAHR